MRRSRQQQPTVHVVHSSPYRYGGYHGYPYGSGYGSGPGLGMGAGFLGAGVYKASRGILVLSVGGRVVQEEHVVIIQPLLMPAVTHNTVVLFGPHGSSEHTQLGTR